jgi:hypothetical protein
MILTRLPTDSFYLGTGVTLFAASCFAPARLSYVNKKVSLETFSMGPMYTRALDGSILWAVWRKKVWLTVIFSAPTHERGVGS